MVGAVKKYFEGLTEIEQRSNYAGVKTGELCLGWLEKPGQRPEA